MTSMGFVLGGPRVLNASLAGLRIISLSYHTLHSEET
jgi:hypothetical protein